MSNRKLGPQSTVSLKLPNKPQIPKSTPAPGPNGRLSAYSSVSSLYCGKQSSIYDSPGLPNPNKRVSSLNAELTQSSHNTSQINSQSDIKDALVTKKLKRTHNQRTKRVSVESLQSQTSIASKTSSMNIELYDIIKNLPFDDREKVTSLVNMAVYSADCSQKECHGINIELEALKASYRVKFNELKSVHAECDLYRAEIDAMEGKLNSLEDDAESRQNYALRNTKAISRLSSTNKTLIDAFVLIHEEHPKKKGGESQHCGDELKAIPEGSSVSTLGGNSSAASSSGNGVKLSPISSNRKRDPSAAGGRRRRESRPAGVSKADPNEGTPVTSNEKLRERLLRVAKEHHRVEKNCAGLETKIMELKSSLRVAERRNRQLQLELDELKEHLGSEHHGNSSSSSSSGGVQHSDVNSEVLCGDLASAGGGSDGPVKSARGGSRARVPMTNRLNALVARNAFDAMEGIKQIEALLAHLAQTPSSLLEADIALHLCTRYAGRLFDCEAVALFVLQPGGRVMHRYATGAAGMTVVEVGEEPSIAENTLRTGCMRRFNNNIRNNSLFNPSIDGVDAISTKRVLTFPLRNQEKTLVVGAMHLLNKRNNNKFTEVDELYGSAFSDAIGSYFSCSTLFRRIWLESETLCGIMRASRRLLESLPPVSSMVASRALLPEEVLYSVEHVVRNALKCTQVKAFLISTHCGYENEFFIALEKPSMGMMTLKPEHLSCHSLPCHSGIAGHVAFTKTPYLVCDPSSDTLFNTQIDIAKKCETFYSVPILNISREVIAVIQVVPSALSPNLRSSKEMGDSTVAFENAVDWLLHLLAANFSFMVKSIGQPLPRPDIQYLEPITLTEKFATMDISLEAAPLDDLDQDRVSSSATSKPDSPLESGRPRSRTIDEDVNEDDDDDNEEGDDDFCVPEEASADTRPRSGNIVNKYERQILALEKEIQELKTSEDVSQSKEKENQLRLVLQEDFASRYEADLARRKADVKLRHDRAVEARRRAVNAELSALRERVARQVAENEAAAEELAEQEARKDEASRRVVEESLLSWDDGLVLSQTQTQTAAQELELEQEEQEQTQMQASEQEEQEKSVQDQQEQDQEQEQEQEQDHDQDQQDEQEQQDQDQQEESAAAVVIDATTDVSLDHADSQRQHDNDIVSTGEQNGPTAQTVAALETGSSRATPQATPRSAKSTRSEMPPTPTKAEVEATPGLGDWLECFDAQGYKYYYNTVTEESSWEVPEGFIEVTAVEDTYNEDDEEEGGDVVRIGEWTQAYTEEGHVYWVHDLTGESTWDTPTDDSAVGLGHHSPQGHSQSAPVLSAYSGAARVTAGDYSIEL